MVPTKQVKSVHDVVQFAVDAKAKWGSGPWWRGQPRSKPLIPGIYREIQSEQNLTLQFMHRAPVRHANCPAHLDYPAWLFFMQHYGLRTRLLDWSGSALFAAFFAVERDPLQTGEVWALNPVQLNKNQINHAVIMVPENSEVAPLFEGAFRQRGHAGKIVAVGAREIDMRMMVQQSAFTIHDTTQPLEQLPESETFLMRFEVAGTDKPLVRSQLAALGVERWTLFPDLETLAKGLMGEL